MRSVAWLALSAAVWIAGCAIAPAPREEPPAPAIEAVRRSPLAEPPGAYLAEVTQATISTTICVSGWTATVRPAPSFTNGVKLLMLKRAGLDPVDAAKYELDHFVPLALGGHPRSEDNLWLQPWSGLWSAKVKDRLERKLQVLVCAGQLSLRSAREVVQKGWKDAYRKFVGAMPRSVEDDEDETVA
jgi:hypothetical protein